MAKATPKKQRANRAEHPRHGKPVSASRSEMTEVVLPQDANPSATFLADA